MRSLLPIATVMKERLGSAQGRRRLLGITALAALDMQRDFSQPAYKSAGISLRFCRLRWRGT